MSMPNLEAFRGLLRIAQEGRSTLSSKNIPNQGDDFLVEGGGVSFDHSMDRTGYEKTFFLPLPLLDGAASFAVTAREEDGAWELTLHLRVQWYEQRSGLFHRSEARYELAEGDAIKLDASTDTDTLISAILNDRPLGSYRQEVFETSHGETTRALLPEQWNTDIRKEHTRGIAALQAPGSEPFVMLSNEEVGMVGEEDLPIIYDWVQQQQNQQT